MCRFSLIFILLFFFQSSSFAQIRLLNASFEGEAQDATIPQRWHPCKEGSTPDVLPGSWGVTTEAADGETYMGLITRQDGTWESVGQRLSSNMTAGECYNFSAELAHSKKYSGYFLPIRLRIWGAVSKCGKKQLLAESGMVDNAEWEEYKFEFYPKENYNYIIFEAFFAPGISIPYKGNILIDNCSTIEPCKRADLEAIPVENNSEGTI